MNIWGGSPSSSKLKKRFHLRHEKISLKNISKSLNFNKSINIPQVLNLYQNLDCIITLMLFNKSYKYYLNPNTA